MNSKRSVEVFASKERRFSAHEIRFENIDTDTIKQIAATMASHQAPKIPHLPRRERAP